MMLSSLSAFSQTNYCYLDGRSTELAYILVTKILLCVFKEKNVLTSVADRSSFHTTEELGFEYALWFSFTCLI